MPSMLKDDAQARVQHSHRVNQAAHAPVEQLPPETLGEIFLHCLPFPSAPISSHQAPLLLISVCQNWRRVALGTPRLWTELDLGAGFVLNPYAIIPIWLFNSGTLLINFTMRPSSWPMMYDKRYVRLVVQNMHRFRRFSGELDESMEEELSSCLRTVLAPSLEFFELRFDDGYKPVSHLTDCIRAPRLTTLSLDHTMMMDLIEFDPLLLRNLALDDQHSAGDRPLSLYSMAPCTNVSFLSITLTNEIRIPRAHGDSRILLPSLATLVIRCRHSNNPALLLDAIEAPVLKDFEISTLDKRRELGIYLSISSLRSFLGLNPPLRRLSLDGVIQLTNEGLPSLLPRLQQLHSIVIKHSEIPMSVLKVLTPDPSTPPTSWICPRLSTLCTVDAAISWHESLLKLISSRAPRNPDVTASGGACLRHVDVRGLHVWHAGVAEGMASREWLAALEEIAQDCSGLLEIKY